MLYPTLAVVLFPVLWAVYFVLRFLVFDVLMRAVLLVHNLFISPLAFLRSLLTLPFYLVLDIVLSLVFSFLSALQTCKTIYYRKFTVKRAIIDGVADLKQRGNSNE